MQEAGRAAESSARATEPKPGLPCWISPT